MLPTQFAVCLTWQGNELQLAQLLLLLLVLPLANLHWSNRCIHIWEFYGSFMTSAKWGVRKRETQPNGHLNVFVIRYPAGHLACAKEMNVDTDIQNQKQKCDTARPLELHFQIFHLVSDPLKCWSCCWCWEGGGGCHCRLTECQRPC